MRKLILISASTLIFCCCKKEYTCECMTRRDFVLSSHKIKAKKEVAESECNTTCYQEHGTTYEGSRVK